MELPDSLQPFLKKTTRYGLVTLTVSEAAALVALVSEWFQRPVRLRLVADLADVLAAREWVGWPLLTLVVGKDHPPMVIDCQHRLRAHIEAGRRAGGSLSVEYLVQVVRGIEPPEAYSRLDVVTQPRSPADVGRAMVLPVPPRFVASALSVALKALRYRLPHDTVVTVDGKAVSVLPAYRDRRAYVVERSAQFHQLGEMVAPAAGPCTVKVRSRLLSSSFAAVCLETLAHAPDAALEFWSVVLHEEGAKKQWHTFARERIIEALPETVPGRPFHRLYGVVTAWNAFVDKTRQAPVPLTVLGPLPVKDTPVSIR